jgi:hypothetical protein
MKTFEVEWNTTNPHASDDDIVNGIREAIARWCDSSNGIKPAQVGDCVISMRNHTTGLAHVHVDGPMPMRYLWQDLDIEVREELSYSHLLGWVLN